MHKKYNRYTTGRNGTKQKGDGLGIGKANITKEINQQVEKISKWKEASAGMKSQKSNQTRWK